MGYLLFFLYITLGKIIAIIIGFYYYRYLSWPYKLVLLLVILGLGAEITGHYLNQKHIPNAWLFNLYMPLEPILLGAAGTGFMKLKMQRQIVAALIIINTIIWLFMVCRYSIYNFANGSMVCGCLLLVGIYIAVLFNDAVFSNKALIKEPSFWLSLSVILYFGCDIPYMGMFHYLKIERSDLMAMTIVNEVLDFLRYPLVAVSLLLVARQRLSELKPSKL